MRIDVDDTVLLGELCDCVREEGLHALGVHLHHTLTLSDELVRLMQGLLGESSPPDRDAEGPQSHYRQASDPVVDRCQKHHQQRNEQRQPQPVVPASSSQASLDQELKHPVFLCRQFYDRWANFQCSLWLIAPVPLSSWGPGKIAFHPPPAATSSVSIHRPVAEFSG